MVTDTSRYTINVSHNIMLLRISDSLNFQNFMDEKVEAKDVFRI